MLSDWRIDAFVAGAEKAGTTSLGYYFTQHPGIHSHFNKPEHSVTQIIEFAPFIDDRWKNRSHFEQDYLAAFGRNPAPGEFVVAKSVGILHRRGAAENLKEYSPECKIIVSLRNPVDRAYSSYWYQRFRGEETARRFEDAIDNEICGLENGRLSRHRQYLGKSRYYEQLKALRDLFGEEKIHVVLVEDLKNSPTETMSKIFEFLGLPDHKVVVQSVRNPAKFVRSPSLAQFIGRENYLKPLARKILKRSVRMKLTRWIRLKNSSNESRERMNPETRAMLIDYFRPHNALLEEMLGRDLDYWNE
jgi:hypothetical protein